MTLVALAAGACGSKGDPLPPLRLAPGKPEALTAVRIEGRPVTLTFAIPAVNHDGSTPVDIASVRVFAITRPATDPAPEAAALVGDANRLATLDVAQAPPDGGVATSGTPAVPGATTTWEDTVSTAPPGATPVTRYYVVAGFSRGGRVGMLSDVVAVPLTPLEGAPAQLSASFTERAIKLEWLGVSPETRYRVYEVRKEQPDIALTPAPIPGTSFEAPLVAPPAEGTPAADPRAAFGVERCFVVRAALASTRATVESAAAGPVCVTPRDVFPPPAPAGLTAVAAPGSINLIWDAVEAADLGGYIVLRGDATGDTLTPLFDAPITETTFRDTTIETGRRYVYAVVAVDTASPANRSAESNRVEETGRQVLKPGALSPEPGA